MCSAEKPFPALAGMSLPFSLPSFPSPGCALLLSSSSSEPARRGEDQSGRGEAQGKISLSALVSNNPGELLQAAPLARAPSNSQQQGIFEKLSVLPTRIRCPQGWWTKEKIPTQKFIPCVRPALLPAGDARASPGAGSRR